MTRKLDWSEDDAKAIVAAQQERGLMVVLAALNEAFGYVHRDAIGLAAKSLNLSRAEVHGVASFYHDFREKPPGRHVLKLCGAEACQSMGGDALAAQATRELGIGFGETTPDEAITLERVYCLGLCACAPAALLDGEPHARLDQSAITSLIGEHPGAAGVSPAAVSGRDASGPRKRVFVSRDACAIAVGAERVATALAAAATRAALDIEIVRTGSRGLYWLEPLVEVETPTGRVAYGPIRPEDVPGLFACGFLDGARHARALGATDSIPWLKRQTRLTFARCGIIDPLSLDDYRTYGGYKGLARALTLKPRDIIEEVARSGLRGRGGAGFPTGIKWRTTADAKGDTKYIVCNADEGDSGTFADRMLMEGDPFLLIEGMTIAALAAGATKGVIYCRSEYPHAIATMRAAIARARDAKLLGPRVADSAFAFDIDLIVGAGSYVCGEETALLESAEGKRGQVRAKPPLPAHAGLFGKPTVVNNVLTFAAAAWILAEGAEEYNALGYGRSRGTMPIQLAGNLKFPGLFETPFGITLGELIDAVGGGTASGRPVRAVQAGGPLGAYFPRALFDTPYDYEAFTKRDGLIGHGGLVAFDDTVDMAKQARFAMEFCALESCGKCTPCRIGSVRGVEVIDRIVGGENREANATLLKELCETLKWGSLCALGGFTPYPVMSALTHFPEDFGLARELAEV